MTNFDKKKTVAKTNMPFRVSETELSFVSHLREDFLLVLTHSARFYSVLVVHHWNLFELNLFDLTTYV